MNKPGRAIVKDSREKTDDKLWAPILLKDLYRYLEGASRTFGEKSRGKSGMAGKIETDTIVNSAIPTFLFFGYLSSPLGTA